MSSCHHFGCVLIVLLAGLFTTQVESYDYKRQDRWKGLCKTGAVQSPIDLDFASADMNIYPVFNFLHFNLPLPGNVINNGHTVEIQFMGRNPVKVSGGGLPYEYVLKTMVLHWPSEHTFRGERFALEIQMIHYANKYGDMEGALKHHDGIAVLAIWCELSIDDDDFLDVIIESVYDVQKTLNKPVPLTSDMRIASFLPRDYGSYFRYNGSLTTPECNENVIWTIFTSTIPISHKQLEVLSDVVSKHNETIDNNARRISPRNGRDVKYRKLYRSKVIEHDYCDDDDSFSNVPSYLHSLRIRLILIWTAIVNFLV